MIGDDFMELRSVKEEIKKYPKMGQVKSKELKKCITGKWSKIGVTSFALGLILENTAQAVDVVPVLDPVKSPVRSISNELFVVLSVVSAIRSNS